MHPEGAVMADAATTLWEIEAIKQLKARYCRYLDTKQWGDWRGLFTEDFVSDTSPSGGKRIAGADEFVSFVRGALGKPSNRPFTRSMRRRSH